MCFPNACDQILCPPQSQPPSPREGPQHAHSKWDAPSSPGCGPGNCGLDMNEQVRWHFLVGTSSHLDSEPTGHTQVPAPGVPVGTAQTAPLLPTEVSDATPKEDLRLESEAGQGLLLRGSHCPCQMRCSRAARAGHTLSTDIELGLIQKSGRRPYLPPRASL